MRKSLFFRLRALAGLSGLVRHSEGNTPLTIHPRAARPEAMSVLGRCQVSDDGGLLSVGRYNSQTNGYDIPLAVTGEDGVPRQYPVSVTRPLCGVDGYACDELDLCTELVHYRTHTLVLSEYSHQITVYGSVNGRRVFKIALSIPAQPIPLACFSNGLTPRTSSSQVGTTNYACTIGQKGASLLFTLGEELNTLEEIKEAVLTAPFRVVYARAVEETVPCIATPPVLPSPVCRFSMYDGVEAGISVDYFPVLQGG